MNRRMYRSRGMALFHAVVYLGFAGILIANFLEVTQFGLRSEKRLTIATDSLALQMMLLNGVSCAETFASNPCPSALGSFVNLKGINGATIVSGSSPASLFGELTVRAECNTGNDGIIVKAVRLKKGAVEPLTTTLSNNFIPDPLTKKTFMWESSQAMLFGQNIELCKGGSDSPISSLQVLQNIAVSSVSHIRSGVVLQMVTARPANVTALSGAAAVKAAGDLTITPTSKNSKILFDCSFYGNASLSAGCANNPFGTGQCEANTSTSFFTYETTGSLPTLLNSTALGASLHNLGAAATSPLVVRSMVANTQLAPRSFGLYISAASLLGTSTGTAASILCTATEIQN